MNQRKVIFLLLFVSLSILASFIFLADSMTGGLPAPEKIQGSALANIPPVEDAIRSIQNKIEQNPQDAVSYTLLGDLYLRQARETGDVAIFQRAEESLTHALELLPGYTPARVSLASAYYSQHEFEKALKLARQIFEENPKNVQARIIMADSYLSLGNYHEADAIYDDLALTISTPPLLARIAYLEELKGNQEKALDLMRQAAGDALHSGGTKENAAWYLLRVGDVNFNMGEIEEAGRYYEASLRVFDNYPLALAGMGKVRAAEGRYEDAIAYYQRAVNTIPQPEYLAGLGDLYALTDQPDLAQLQYETVEYIGTLAALNEQVYNRALANFYSDHDQNPEEALRLALAELETRKDIFGYDAAAWAHYKNGNYEEAQGLIEQALSMGTRDARLYFHAGMIAYALGHDQPAREYLQQALTINPHFSILDTETARETLDALQLTAGK
jgi:tetratricopeptide (TPR) repeat protein